eukprot:1335027-Amorphochlora_amoeboformis.AAC.1
MQQEEKQQKREHVRYRLDDVEVLQTYDRQGMAIPIDFPEREELEDHIRMMLHLERADRILQANREMISNPLEATRKKMISFRELTNVITALQGSQNQFRNKIVAEFIAFVQDAGNWVATAHNMLGKKRCMLHHLQGLQDQTRSKFPSINFDSINEVSKRLQCVRKWVQKEKKAICNGDTLASLRKLLNSRKDECGDTVSQFTIRIEIEVLRAQDWSDRLANAIKEKAPKNAFESLIREVENGSAPLLVESDDLEHAKSFVTRYCLCQDVWRDGVFMIGCDHCDGWYHPKCINTTQEQVGKLKSFQCPNCCLKKGVSFKYGDAKALVRAASSSTTTEGLAATENGQLKPVPKVYDPNLSSALPFVNIFYENLGRSISAETCETLWRELAKFSKSPLDLETKEDIVVVGQKVCGSQLVKDCLKQVLEEYNDHQNRRDQSFSSERGNGNRAGKKIRKRAQKPKDHPATAKTAYKCFVHEYKRHHNKDLMARAKNEGKTAAQVTGELWRQMTEEAKKRYYDLAEKDRERFKRELKEYQRKHSDLAQSGGNSPLSSMRRYPLDDHQSTMLMDSKNVHISSAPHTMQQHVQRVQPGSRHLPVASISMATPITAEVIPPRGNYNSRYQSTSGQQKSHVIYHSSSPESHQQQAESNPQFNVQSFQFFNQMPQFMKQVGDPHNPSSQKGKAVRSYMPMGSRQMHEQQQQQPRMHMQMHPEGSYNPKLVVQSQHLQQPQGNIRGPGPSQTHGLSYVSSSSSKPYAGYSAMQEDMYERQHGDNQERQQMDAIRWEAYKRSQEAAYSRGVLESHEADVRTERMYPNQIW